MRTQGELRGHAVLRFGPCAIDVSRREVRRQDTIVHLTPTGSRRVLQPGAECVADALYRASGAGMSIETQGGSGVRPRNADTPPHEDASHA